MVSQVSYKAINLVSSNGSVSITDLANGDTDLQTAGGGGPTTLTGDVTGSGTGTIATTLANSGVTAGSYTYSSITVNSKGLVTAASTGAAPGAAGSTTQVQYNNAGAFAGNANFTYDSGTNTITFGNITGSELTLRIQPRAPTILEAPGNLNLFAQRATTGNVDGGSVSILGENALGFGTGNGGSISLNGGDGAVGGGLNLYAGQSRTGLGAGASMYGGFHFAVGGVAGTTNVIGGYSFGTNGRGGAASVVGGQSIGTGSIAGNAILQAGSCSAGTRNGYVNLISGSASARYCFQGGSNGLAGAATIRFFAVGDGSDLVTQRAAYTQTFSTASRTVSNPTFSNLATTAATNVSPFGFTTQAQADDIATKVNQLAADVVILRQLINSLIDDSQAYGLAQ